MYIPNLRCRWLPEAHGWPGLYVWFANFDKKISSAVTKPVFVFRVLVLLDEPMTILSV
jgi:hypothetical protein